MLIAGTAYRRRHQPTSFTSVHNVSGIFVDDDEKPPPLPPFLSGPTRWNSDSHGLAVGGGGGCSKDSDEHFVEADERSPLPKTAGKVSSISNLSSPISSPVCWLGSARLGCDGGPASQPACPQPPFSRLHPIKPQENWAERRKDHSGGKRVEP